MVLVATVPKEWVGMYWLMCPEELVQLGGKLYRLEELVQKWWELCVLSPGVKSSYQLTLCMQVQGGV